MILYRLYRLRRPVSVFQRRLRVATGAVQPDERLPRRIGRIELHVRRFPARPVPVSQNLRRHRRLLGLLRRESMR